MSGYFSKFFWYEVYVPGSVTISCMYIGEDSKGASHFFPEGLSDIGRLVIKPGGNFGFPLDLKGISTSGCLPVHSFLQHEALQGRVYPFSLSTNAQNVLPGSEGEGKHEQSGEHSDIASYSIN
jgi:hypothetical protein